MSVQIMPEDFKGEFITNGGITKSNPRRWTDKEIKWCLYLKKQGYSIKDIAKSTNRNHVSTSIKLKGG